MSEETLWYRDEAVSLDQSQGNTRKKIPFLIGQSNIYAATWSSYAAKYVLEAYDFRSGRQLYESAVLPGDWSMRTGMDQVGYVSPNFRGHKLLKTAKDEELLMLFANQLLGVGIDIVQGSTGLCIYRIAPTLLDISNVLVHSLTSQFVIVDDFTCIISPFWTEHRISVLRSFAYQQNSNTVSWLHTDVVLAPQYTSPGHHRLCQSLLAINPFTMTAI
ncbi:hypothetical protein BJY04DRAFT_54122 [Aspergillus karnatakaensis]|uniref:uncharacterized protein n=1 Tax=Aspergillus karnatakaensis TaxID=1810916 RepID=UPI003CCE0A9A